MEDCKLNYGEAQFLIFLVILQGLGQYIRSHVILNSNRIKWVRSYPPFFLCVCDKKKLIKFNQRCINPMVWHTVNFCTTAHIQSIIKLLILKTGIHF
jgi:hypothetical protein